MNAVANPFTAQPIENMVSDFVAKLILMHDWRFFADNRPLSVSMMSSNRSILPAVLWEAEKQHRHLLSAPIGIQFRSDGDATVGAQAVIGDMAGRSKGTLMIFTMHALVHLLNNYNVNNDDVTVTPEDLRDNILQGSAVPPKGAGASVDHLVNAFLEDHNRNLIPWTPDSQPKAPNLSWKQG